MRRGHLAAAAAVCLAAAAAAVQLARVLAPEEDTPIPPAAAGSAPQLDPAPLASAGSRAAPPAPAEGSLPRQQQQQQQDRERPERLLAAAAAVGSPGPVPDARAADPDAVGWAAGAVAPPPAPDAPTAAGARLGPPPGPPAMARLGVFLWNVTPLCIVHGQGWATFADGDSIHGIAIETEFTRVVEPVRLRPPPEGVLLDPRPAVLAPVAMDAFATDNSTKPSAPFYHFIWQLLASAAAMPTGHQAVYTATVPRACCSQTVLGIGPSCTAEQRCPLGECSPARGDGCGRVPLTRRHPLWPLTAALSPAALPSEDFAAQGRPGTAVCHSWGLVGSGDVRRWLGAGARVTAALDAGGDVVPMERWEAASLLRTALARHLLRSSAAQLLSPPPADGSGRRRRLLIVRREHSRRLTNADELAAAGRRAGWEVAAPLMERLTIAEQFTLAAGADFAVQVHGSAMTWAIVAAPHSTWAECVHAAFFSPALLGAGAARARSHGRKSIGVRHYRPLAAVGVNTGRRLAPAAQYGSFAWVTRYAGAQYLGFLAGGGTKKCAMESLAAAMDDPTHVDNRLRKNKVCICRRWKKCDVLIPLPVFRLMARCAEAKLRGETPCPPSQTRRQDECVIYIDPAERSTLPKKYDGGKGDHAYGKKR
eukprot:TRINITY_DN23032_c0_g1_i1.p1 TRINITY_DN23032_c0_g1~~TRINITY_DN23032_c0_g1_i1.p1  ORF type:complete len:650 (+),score=167.26 TRINITY_DN23032_c0_g1_i1:112-2061(+)